MPILELTVVGELAATVKQNFARRLANATGHALGDQAHRVWVVVNYVPADCYAEWGGGLRKSRPVFVRVLRRELPAGAALAGEVAALTKIVADASGRPATDVHLIYEPPGAGRVSFGGELVPPSVG